MCLKKRRKIPKIMSFSILFKIKYCISCVSVITVVIPFQALTRVSVLGFTPYLCVGNMLFWVLPCRNNITL